MRLAAVDVPSTTNTDVYTVPSNRRASFTLSLCNRTSTARTVRVALRSGTLTDADYIEFDTTLPANGVLERSGLVLGAGQVCVVRTSATGVSAVVYGVEEQV